MEIVDIWTGERANALRAALRMTNEGFAQHLGTAVRTVAKWAAQPGLVPVTEMQRALDTTLSHASEDEQRRFALLALSDQPTASATKNPGRTVADGGAADLRLAHDPAIGDALQWLDARAGWPEGEARKRVQSRLQALEPDAFETLAHRRGDVGRAQSAAALKSYYEAGAPNGFHLYSAQCDGERYTTSIVTQPAWLDLDLALGQGEDNLTLKANAESAQCRLDRLAADAAVSRLAETIGAGTRLVNDPLYRLLDIDVSSRGLSGNVGMTTFVEYALTLDLLENELTDALSDGRPVSPGTMPLRDHYLPDAAALTDIGNRLCVGGPVALMAIARPRGRRHTGEPDYILLVQERSGRVLNSARRLAVIPKAFHQPLVDFSDDAQLSATIEREMEEELLGRPELDPTIRAQRSADPMHVSRLSEPMRWLVNHPDPKAWGTECVGFGINSMTGNFECASLIYVNDEQWWEQYGGAVKANWETGSLRIYSSRDRDLLATLVSDPAWSNEGLFAFLQGIRRLAQMGQERVDLPLIEVELS